MSQEIEIEFKNLLTEKEYTNLAETLFANASAFEQINYYFETPAFDLKRQGCALRIRKKKDAYTLTLKEPHPDGLLETHDRLTKEAFKSWLSNQPSFAPNVTKQLEAMDISLVSLVYAGQMTTCRQETVYHDTLIVLDKSNYLNITDAELELEASDRAYGEKIFVNLLKDYHIPKRETPNKIARFFIQKHRQQPAD